MTVVGTDSGGADSDRVDSEEAAVVSSESDAGDDDAASTVTSELSGTPHAAARDSTPTAAVRASRGRRSRTRPRCPILLAAIRESSRKRRGAVGMGRGPLLV